MVHVRDVNFHDGIANYRIRTRGKKWWWPLLINLINSTLVNAWKIYRITNRNKISQLEFESYLTPRFMKTEEAEINDEQTQDIRP